MDEQLKQWIDIQWLNNILKIMKNNELNIFHIFIITMDGWIYLYINKILEEIDNYFKKKWTLEKNILDITNLESATSDLSFIIKQYEINSFSDFFTIIIKLDQKDKIFKDLLIIIDELVRIDSLDYSNNSWESGIPLLLSAIIIITSILHPWTLNWQHQVISHGNPMMYNPDFQKYLNIENINPNLQDNVEINMDSIPIIYQMPIWDVYILDKIQKTIINSSFMLDIDDFYDNIWPTDVLSVDENWIYVQKDSISNLGDDYWYIDYSDNSVLVFKKIKDGIDGKFYISILDIPYIRSTETDYNAISTFIWNKKNIPVWVVDNSKIEIWEVFVNKIIELKKTENLTDLSDSLSYLYLNEKSWYLFKKNDNGKYNVFFIENNWNKITKKTVVEFDLEEFITLDDIETIIEDEILNDTSNITFMNFNNDITKNIDTNGCSIYKNQSWIKLETIMINWKKTIRYEQDWKLKPIKKDVRNIYEKKKKEISQDYFFMLDSINITWNFYKWLDNLNLDDTIIYSDVEKFIKSDKKNKKNKNESYKIIKSKDWSKIVIYTKDSIWNVDFLPLFKKTDWTFWKYEWNIWDYDWDNILMSIWAIVITPKKTDWKISFQRTNDSIDETLDTTSPFFMWDTAILLKDINEAIEKNMEDSMDSIIQVWNIVIKWKKMYVVSWNKILYSFEIIEKKISDTDTGGTDANSNIILTSFWHSDTAYSYINVWNSWNLDSLLDWKYYVAIPVWKDYWMVIRKDWYMFQNTNFELIDENIKNDVNDDTVITTAWNTYYLKNIDWIIYIFNWYDNIWFILKNWETVKWYTLYIDSNWNYLIYDKSWNILFRHDEQLTVEKITEDCDYSNLERQFELTKFNYLENTTISNRLNLSLITTFSKWWFTFMKNWKIFQNYWRLDSAFGVNLNWKYFYDSENWVLYCVDDDWISLYLVDKSTWKYSFSKINIDWIKDISFQIWAFYNKKLASSLQKDVYDLWFNIIEKNIDWKIVYTVCSNWDFFDIVKYIKYNETDEKYYLVVWNKKHRVVINLQE